MRSRGFGRPWGQYFGLFLLAAGTVALIYLALTRNLGGDDAASADDPVVTPTQSTSTSAAPSADPSASATDDPTLSTDPPTVPDQRRVDFTAGGKLPDGALIVDGGGNTSGLAVTKKGLTHGRPTNLSLAGGLIETELDSDVRSLGFRVRFAEKNSGSVTMVGWQSSLAAVFESGSVIPPFSGFRVVASPGEWSLSVLDGEERILAQGTYDAAPGPETFQILRDGAQVFVVDPTGAVTTAADPSVAALAGPWASWGVTEFALNQTPAVIESVWGG